MSDNTAALATTGSVTLGDSLRVDSGVQILHPCAFHAHFDITCHACAVRNGYAASTQTPMPAQCELVDKVALDALREAAKPIIIGAGKAEYWAAQKGASVAEFLVPARDMMELLAAVARLLGEGGK